MPIVYGRCFVYA